MSLTTPFAVLRQVLLLLPLLLLPLLLLLRVFDCFIQCVTSRAGVLQPLPPATQFHRLASCDQRR